MPRPGKPPDAGEVTLTSPGSTLATLVPDPFVDGHGILRGMTDLGWAWFAPLSNYEPVASGAWSLGSTLQVHAAGNEIEAFSGSLQAGPALTGVTPAIGAATLMVDHAKPFEISWTPSTSGDATVLLGIPNGEGICYCDAPDSAGSLTVDSSLLAPVSGEISLARLTVSNVVIGNASIDLVGATVQRGPLEVR